LTAQQHKIDSLRRLVGSLPEDTELVKTLNSLSEAYKGAGKYDSGVWASTEAINHARKQGSSILMAGSHLTRGESLDLSGKLPDALKEYFAALHIYDSLIGTNPDKKLLIACKKGAASAYGNIGVIYQTQGDFDNAIKNQLSDLDIALELNDTKLLGSAYNNIGTIYYSQNKLQLSLDSYLKALEYKMKLGSNRGIASTYTNIGSVYLSKGDSCAKNSPEKKIFYAKALENFEAGLALYEKMNLVGGIIANKINIGQLYRESDPAKSRQLVSEALELSLQTGYLEAIKTCYSSLYKTDSIAGDYKSAFSELNLFYKYRDSLVNEANTKKSVEEQMKHDFDKQRAEEKAAQDKKDAVAAEEKRKQQIILWFVAGMLLLVIVFALFIYRSYKQKQQANIEISLQKDIIEEKQKEIIDSIHYAKRIQLSLLPNEKMIERKLKDLKKDQ
jgi:tetratricopeptide (TPR) repeat protein